MRGILARLREWMGRYFVAGLLVCAPIGITLWSIAWVVQRLDNLVLPHLLRLVLPSSQDPPQLPFVGAIVTLLVIMLLGVAVRHLFGMEVVRLWERLLQRVPVARSIYAGVKQLLEAIFVSSEAVSFNRVVLLEYPRKGLYAIAFSTGPARGIVQKATPKRMINCFVPTTPNPTSGFYILAPEDELIEVNLSVEDAFKLVMSAGLVNPERLATNAPEAPALGAPVTVQAAPPEPGPQA